MNSFSRYLDRHPLIVALLLLALMSIAGSMDRSDQERIEGYRDGFKDGQRAAYVRAVDPDPSITSSHVVASK